MRFCSILAAAAAKTEPEPEPEPAAIATKSLIFDPSKKAFLFFCESDPTKTFSDHRKKFLVVKKNF